MLWIAADCEKNDLLRDDKCFAIPRMVLLANVVTEPTSLLKFEFDAMLVVQLSSHLS
jgi:hypothetical protein